MAIITPTSATSSAYGFITQQNYYNAVGQMNIVQWTNFPVTSASTTNFSALGAAMDNADATIYQEFAAYGNYSYNANGGLLPMNPAAQGVLTLWQTWIGCYFCYSSRGGLDTDFVKNWPMYKKVLAQIQSFKSGTKRLDFQPAWPLITAPQ